MQIRWVYVWADVHLQRTSGGTNQVVSALVVIGP